MFFAAVVFTLFAFTWFGMYLLGKYITQIRDAVENVPARSSVYDIARHVAQDEVWQSKKDGGSKRPLTKDEKDKEEHDLVQVYLDTPIDIVQATPWLGALGENSTFILPPHSKLADRGEIKYSTTLGQLLNKLLRANNVIITGPSSGSLEIEPRRPYNTSEEIGG